MFCRSCPAVEPQKIPRHGLGLGFDHDLSLWLRRLGVRSRLCGLILAETAATLAAKGDTTNPFKPKFPQRNKNKGTAPAAKP